ncbi:MAG: DUF2784 domain-containing protein [Nitrospiria bacterium]
MLYRVLADFVVLLHFAFICFVVLGGFFLFRWRRVIWLHLPAVTWAVLIELKGGICPLTPLEQGLRQAAGDAGYQGGFIEHYVVSLIYPNRLTPALQVAIGVFVALLNTALYGWLLYRTDRKNKRDP